MSASDLTALAEYPLPADDLNSALPHLRRPFSKDAVKWKVQTSWEGGAMIVAHIDARLVIERLNAVVGGEWEEDYIPVGQAMRCDLSVFGKTRKGYGTAGAFEPAKSMESDSLKRAAVKFGVGMSVYSLARVILNTGGDPLTIANEKVGVGIKQKKKPKKGGGEQIVTDITPVGDKWLQYRYGLWLDAKTKGGKFGPVLDHGGSDDEQGVEEDAPAEPVSDAALPLEDARAQELKAACERAFERLQQVDAAALLPGAFKAELEKASSHEELVALQERLDGMARGVSS